MTSKAAVNGFLAQRTWAVAGASRTDQKFGNMAYRELKARGNRLLPVHPSAESIEGDRCYASLKALPEPAGVVLVVTPPAQTEQVVQDAAAADIRRVWMQQGAESEAAIRFCQERGIEVVHGECIMMFVPEAGFGHRMHRWVWGLLGKLPK